MSQQEEKSEAEKMMVQAERDRKKAEKLAKKQAGAKRSGTELLAGDKPAEKTAAERKEEPELPLEERFQHFAVGQIRSLSDVVGKPGLKKCTVGFSEGAGGRKDVVLATRAKNVAVGQRVPVACEGAVVTMAKGGSFTVTESEVGGVVSAGAICDSEMLGWTGKPNANLHPRGQAVLLPEDYPLGTLPPGEPTASVPAATAPVPAATKATSEAWATGSVDLNPKKTKPEACGGVRSESEEEKLKREQKKAEKAAIKAAKAKGLPPPPKTEKLSAPALAAVSTPANSTPPQLNSSPSLAARGRGRGGEAGMFPDTDNLANNGSFSGAALGVVSPEGANSRSPAVKPQQAGSSGSGSSLPPSASKAPKPALPQATADTEAERRHAEEEAQACLNNPLLNPPKPVFVMDQAKMKLIHPRFAELGVMFRSYQLVGSNARCMALLEALEELISSSSLLISATSLDGREATELLKHVEANIEYLHLCREPCVGMRYIVERFKSTILHYAVNSSASTATLLNTCPGEGSGMAPSGLPSVGSSTSLSTMGTPICAPSANQGRRQTHSKKNYTPLDFIKEVIGELRETIWSGLQSIVKDFAPQHIHDGDVILTYGRSSSVEALLKEAKTIGGKRFSVVVIDSAPLFEGRGLSARLQLTGISVTYGLLSSVCVLAPKCTKAIFGSSAVLQSGDVVSRSGTAMAALVMKKERKPVLFLSELYKLTTSVWLLSLTINEDTRTVTDRVRTKIGQQQPVPRYAYGTYVPRRREQPEHDDAASSESWPLSSPTTTSRPFFWTPPPGSSPRTSMAAHTPTTRKTLSLAMDRPETPSAGGNKAGAAATPSPPPMSFAGMGLGEDASAGCSSNSVQGAIADDGYLYDITPRSLIDMVVTDIGPLHPTAIASAVRERDEREKGKLSRETGTKAAWGLSGGGVGGAMTPSRMSN